MGQRIDLTGKKFGRLTFIEYAGNNRRNRALWKCVCDCGNVTVARADALKSGDKQSCGCLNSENKSKWCKERNTIHGMAHTRLYTVWCDMRRRCNNEKTPEYKNYGGRGIKVCAEWDRDFGAFYCWAMANGYDETAKRGECTIDRIDVNGNYCPENCRFVDSMIQAGNKRNNRMIEHNGEVKTQAEWARFYGKRSSFFCGPDDIVERRMSGCDEYIQNNRSVPKYAHCISQKKKGA